VSINEFLSAIAQVILNPLIIFAFVVASLYFFWGIFQFVMSSGNGDASGQTKGKQTILWGLIGMFIMVSVFGIIRVVLKTFNITPSSTYVDTLIND
jgi:hypothetical protein